MQAENRNTKAQMNLSVLSDINAYFIPEIKTINGIKVPSTPFFNHKGEAIFLGDVIKIEFNDNDDSFNEINIVNLVDGQYVTTGKKTNINSPLFMHDPSEIKTIGNAIENKSLLTILN